RRPRPTLPPPPTGFGSRAARLVVNVNFLSVTTNRYRYGIEVDEEARRESGVFKDLAFEVVFLSPELKQLEHKGTYVLRKLWDLLEKRYVRGEAIDGQGFQILREEDAQEIEEAETPRAKARLVCDLLAGMTDGSAVRMYRRLFEPGFGSIGDLV
ncbi:MAG: hypothetical protein AAGC74_09390, partial [Verrucomicrobiota bacterium]